METQGGLYVPAGKERHVFKAPAPRPSLLGSAQQAVHQDHCSPALRLNNWRSLGSLAQSSIPSVYMCMAHAGLDKLAQQKREDAGNKALPALGKRPRPDLDSEEDAVPTASTSQSDDRKSKQRHYRSSRLDTPSHPGVPLQASLPCIEPSTRHCIVPVILVCMHSALH